MEAPLGLFVDHWQVGDWRLTWFLFRRPHYKGGKTMPGWRSVLSERRGKCLAEAISWCSIENVRIRQVCIFNVVPKRTHNIALLDARIHQHRIRCMSRIVCRPCWSNANPWPGEPNKSPTLDDKAALVWLPPSTMHRDSFYYSRDYSTSPLYYSKSCGNIFIPLNSRQQRSRPACGCWSCSLEIYSVI